MFMFARPTGTKYPFLWDNTRYSCETYVRTHSTPGVYLNQCDAEV